VECRALTPIMIVNGAFQLQTQRGLNSWDRVAHSEWFWVIDLKQHISWELVLWNQYVWSPMAAVNGNVVPGHGGATPMVPGSWENLIRGPMAGPCQKCIYAMDHL
jgi:hypothetical protein